MTSAAFPGKIAGVNHFPFTFYEFFAGGGMARAGLGDNWQCLFANDFDEMKAAAYARNWGGEHLICADVAKIKARDLPGIADLAWASFPCQDLSLAGEGRGLGPAASTAATRSGTFWPFWSVTEDLARLGRAPRMIALENVYGVLTSHRGADFVAICAALGGAGYRFGAMVIDARLFVPQSRPRVFFIAVAPGWRIPATLIADGPSDQWHPPALIKARNGASAQAAKNWIWWGLPEPPLRNAAFADLIEEDPSGVAWHSPAQTEYLLSLMSPLNQAKVAAAKKAANKAQGRIVGGIYRRTRPDGAGGKHQRAEARFDEVAGCLRTPRGGSSRQTIIIVEGARVRTRLLSPREAARLMGLDDAYQLPERYNDAYHVAGDGVCVPVVRHLAKNLLEPIAAAKRAGLPLSAAE